MRTLFTGCARVNNYRSDCRDDILQWILQSWRNGWVRICVRRQQLVLKGFRKRWGIPSFPAARTAWVVVLWPRRAGSSSLAHFSAGHAQFGESCVLAEHQRGVCLLFGAVEVNLECVGCSGVGCSDSVGGAAVSVLCSLQAWTIIDLGFRQIRSEGEIV